MEPIHLQEGPVAVRPLFSQDAPLLLRWMTDPRVLAFYGGAGPSVYPGESAGRILHPGTGGAPLPGGV